MRRKLTSLIFKGVASYLRENDTEQITINDLIIKMKDYAGGDAYCHTKMNEELEKYFGEELIIAEIDGKSNVATFCRTASSILHSFYSESGTDDEEVQKEISSKQPQN